MLGAIFNALGGQIVEKLFGSLEAIFKAYFDRQISAEEARAKILTAMFGCFAEIEKAHASALQTTYSAFMAQAGSSVLLRVVWASVVLSQLAVLVWHQVGIPAAVYFLEVRYPSSGTTVDWAYALVAGCVGLGPVVLRTGPAALNLPAWKSLVGR